MPHIHFLLILDEESKISTPDQVDQYVCARLPYLPRFDDLSVEANQQRRLWHTVTSSMLHDCNAACGGLVGRCNKYFPKHFTEHTVLSGLVFLLCFFFVFPKQWGFYIFTLIC